MVMVMVMVMVIVMADGDGVGKDCTGIASFKAKSTSRLVLHLLISRAADASIWKVKTQV